MRRSSGFSLMEMMVVLLIVAIIAAASAPMVSKKMAADAGLGGVASCLWHPNGSDILFNYAGQSKGQRAAIIGTDKVFDKDANSTDKPRFYIKSDNVNNSQIELEDVDKNIAKISFFRNNTWFSTKKMDEDTEDSVAIGMDADAVGRRGAIAIGAKAKSAGNYGSIAIGSNFNNGLLSGNGAEAKNYSIALGSSAASNDNSVALGYKTKAHGTNVVAIGSGTVVNEKANNSVAIGSSTIKKEAKNSVAIGRDINVNGTSSIVIGDGASISSNHSSDPSYLSNNIVLGTGASSNSSNAIAIGNGANATGDGAVIIGNNTGVQTVYSTSSQSVYRSVAIGANAKVGNSDVTAVGSNSWAAKAGTTVVGHNASATELWSTAIGSGAKASAYNATAIGYGAKANSDSQVVIGDVQSTVYIPGNLVVGRHTILGTELNQGNLGVKLSGAYGALTINLSESELGNEKPGYAPRLRTIIEERSGNKLKTADVDYRYEYIKKSNDTRSLCRPAYDTYCTSSDRRLKNVGEVFKGGLEEIKKLEVFNYVYKKDKDKTPRVGVMAQDLQKIFPNAVFKGDDGFLRIRLEDMFYALINAVKELDKRIDLLVEKQKEIDTLRAEVKALKKELEKEKQENQKKYDEFYKRLEKLEKRK